MSKSQDAQAIKDNPVYKEWFDTNVNAYMAALGRVDPTDDKKLRMIAIGYQSLLGMHNNLEAIATDDAVVAFHQENAKKFGVI